MGEASGRMRRAQALMRSEGVELLVVAGGESLRYLTGYAGERACLLVPGEGEPLLLLPEGQALSYGGRLKVQPYLTMPQLLSQVSAFASRLGSDARVAVVAEDSTPLYFLEHLANALPGFELKAARRIMTELRMQKSKAEVRAIRRAAKLACDAMRRAFELLGHRVSRAELAAEVECYLRRRGAELARVEVGPADLRRHRFAVVGISVSCDGYFAELSRAATLGSAGEELHELHSAYLEMLSTALEILKPGVKVMEVEKEVTLLAYERGYGEHYPGGFLHGLGLSVKEAPHYEAYPEDALLELCENSALAVGHALLAGRRTGVRIEETVLLRDSGAEVLTRFPREIAEL